MHELTEELWTIKRTENKDEMDKVITDWLREKAALINFHFKSVTPEGHCYPNGEGILGFLGLGAEKDQCCLPHEPCERCGKEPTPEPRTWPCEHILRTPKWTPGLCEWSYFGSSGVDHEAKWCEFCGAKRPEPKIWCAHIKLKGDTWHFENVDRQDPLISHQVTIEDWEKYCRVCGKERPR